MGSVQTFGDNGCMNRPTTKPDLWLTIYQLFGIRLPHKVFTKGNSSPFAFIADAFLNPAKDVAAWANRRGVKTLAASILAALEYRFGVGRMKGRVLAGSEDQARTLYDYWEKWCWDILRDRLKGDPGRLITRLDNGDFEILAASPKRVRGPGIQRLYWDEVDEIDPDILSASVGTLTSLNGVPARTVATSTWHHAHGPMGQLVGTASERGISLHHWNIWETIAKCPIDRHGGGSNCKSCRLAPACVGKAREFKPGIRLGIAAQCDGLFAIDDAIKQFTNWSAEQWEAEAECKRPSLTGMVYQSFDRRMHVDDDLDFQENLRTYRAIDWGLNDFVCLWIQQGKRGETFIVDEYWAEQATTAQVAQEILQRDKPLRVHATFCDPAGRNRNDQTGRSDVDVFRSFGISCQYATSRYAKEVSNGIALVRAALNPAGGTSSIVVSSVCKRLIRAFESYKLRKVNGEYIDEPVKPQPYDHPMDALRYYFVNTATNQQAQVSTMGYSG